MDYEKLGLKCGIEIHQQLEGKKLFCSCPTIMRDDQPYFTIKRQLRASAGESGEIDIAAAQEQAKKKTNSYEGYYDTTCLVELDEEPPHQVNQEALYTTLQFCKITKCDPVPVVQFMRKTVVDGSNTSGFQRTGLIARNGSISTSAGDVHILNVSLEEDAAKNISESQTERVWRLDRLGIPLIEIGTAPDIKTPEQCLEAAKKIGYLLRSLPGVKRGLGTIRQDVNVSIAGGNRIEIKGAQDLRLIPLWVELEVKRQIELLKIKEELKNIKLPTLQIQDLTLLLRNSTSKIIVNTIKNSGKILGIKLPGFAGYLGRELQPNNRLGTEFSWRAKIKAGVGGIFHSDELPNYGITALEVEGIRREFHCSEKDAFILVADQEHKSLKALEAVYERAQEVLTKIPKEVRKPHDDGTTSFMRPMPGAARMYPETDIPLVRTDIIKVKLPELLEEKISRYQTKFGLSKDLSEYVAKSEKMPLFEELVKKYPAIKPGFIAEVLTSLMMTLKRDYSLDPDKLTEEDFRKLLMYLSQNRIHKDIILPVLIDMCKGEFDIKKYETLGTEEIHKILSLIIKNNPLAPFPALMGLAMKELGGKASGQFISEQLKRLMEKGH